jgi:signal transduction histidine kinase/CheY-like chemotaxis protein
MFAVITCIHEQHDLRLVLFAALICAGAVVTCFNAYRRAVAASGGYRAFWVGLSALVLGAGVWATHFLAMLAYQPGLNIDYDLGLTALSLVLAVAGFAAAFGCATQNQDTSGRLVGGAVAGGGIALMHFIGVAAIRLPGHIQWSPVMAGAAIFLGMAGAAAALWAAGDVRDRRKIALGSVLLVLAICALHFTAMAAVTLVADPTVAGWSGRSVGRPELALQVGPMALLIIMAAAMLSMERFAARSSLGGLKTTLEAVPAAIGFFDRDRRLNYWNPRFADILSTYGLVAAGDLQFGNFLAAASQLGLPAGFVAQASSAESLSDGAVLPEFSLADGRWMRGEMGPTKDGGFIMVISDVTDQRQAAQLAADARRAAEDASRAKSEFLAHVSHEIRTPLNGVLGMAQVMARHSLDAQQADRLALIRSSGAALLGVLNNVLDISKIEAGQLELEHAPFDLAEVVHLACDSFAALADQKELGFRVEIDPAVQGGWSGDAGRLRQVLTNLVSNAFKFTSEGEIVVAVAAQGDLLQFAVRDTGVGVSAEQAPRLFKKFSQAEASTTRKFGGTGLGLAICRELVTLMGGEITVTSEVGVGSVFSFFLPLERAVLADDRASGAAAPDAEVGGRVMRLLAADDNATNRLILAALLEPLGVELICVEDGRRAVEAFQTERFHAVLMDVQMPEMDGVEATAEIRRLEARDGQPRTPVIALTANAMRHQVEAYLAAGMDGFVAKPIEAEKLFDAIHAALGAGPPEAAEAAA